MEIIAINNGHIKQIGGDPGETSDFGGKARERKRKPSTSKDEDTGRITKKWG